MARASAAPSRRAQSGRPTTDPSDAPKAQRRSSSARPARSGGRYAVVYDTNGPRVRLGLAWFALAVTAIGIGPLPTAAVYGGAAAIAAAQTARCWRRRRNRPDEIIAAAMAGLMGAGACFGAGGAGLGILVGVALAFMRATGDTKSPNLSVVDAGWTIQCALPPGIVATSIVLLARLDQGSALALLLLASAYETGDYLVGSGARNPYEGPAAGGAAIVVITFIISTLPISTLDFGEAWLFGGLMLVLAPMGQLLASALLPTAKSPASALRRLDSLLLTAPVWCFGIGLLS